MELTEKFLVSLGGWPAFGRAKALHDAGMVSEAAYDPPLLRGKIREGGKQFLSGLRIKSSSDIENLCPCRESRQRGIICEHALAIGIAVLRPKKTVPTEAPAKSTFPSTRQATEAHPKVIIKLEGSLRHLEAEIDFQYPKPDVSNPRFEAGVYQELLEAGFEEGAGKAVLRGEDGILAFLAAKLPKWKDTWQVETGGRFEHVTKDIVTIEPQFAIRDRDDGWLDFHVHFHAGREAVFSSAELQRLLQSGKPHVRLKNGRIAIANAGLASDLEEVLRDCNPRQERGGYQVPPEQRAYLEASLTAWGVAARKAPKTPTESDLGTLRKNLRNYQVEGALWLLDLARRKSGGILADEMGLGKTVQMLAVMEAMPGPCLVVCPSSLVWNWKKEANKFLPDMPVLTIEGPDRKARFSQLAEARLVVTSYATLRRDIERYAGVVFSTVVLDEAQHIKNPDSQNARSACAIRGDSRFILTGTPVENSLRDLWSLFEFALPGYLGSRNDFRDRYEGPLQAGLKGTTWERLSRRISPHMLRRRKANILPELPDKIEQVIEIELNDGQKAAYTQLQVAAREKIDTLRENGGGTARMQALTALLRLRQACCDLRLLGSESATPSAKRVALMELLEEAGDGGHRTLVFSQFTGVLDLIAGDLQERDIAFVRLDGSTRDRQAVVEEFQNNDTIPVFLISLKAGGTGLNLTAADTVIHYDPWWNPAAEAQASDRAHRIGQKKVVNVIKLIAKDTVEEKVLRMQISKRELLEATLDADAVIGSLSAEDLGELI
ncbi:MAG: SNF2-related protein [Terrimicrobiaceae bacterium]